MSPVTSRSEQTAAPRDRASILQGVLPLDRARLPRDMAAGITLAALGIPEVMGYSNIAGMPVVTGLYTILIPIAVFAVLGSSRHLVVGADSATAAILAAGLASLAATGSPEYVALAGAVAICVGLVLIVARIIKLGFLADFLSRTVPSASSPAWASKSRLVRSAACSGCRAMKHRSVTGGRDRARCASSPAQWETSGTPA
jgi:hypothetical protein